MFLKHGRLFVCMDLSQYASRKYSRMRFTPAYVLKKLFMKYILLEVRPTEIKYM